MTKVLLSAGLVILSGSIILAYALYREYRAQSELSIACKEFNLEHYEKAFPILHELASNNVYSADVMLAAIYASGSGAALSKPEAMDWLDWD